MNAFNYTELAALRSHAPFVPPEIPLGELMDVLLERRFSVEYRPIVSVQAGEVVGYHAKARFWTRDRHPLSTRRMFAYLRRNPLLMFHTELQLKQLQIARFPLRNENANQLMVDLDIESFVEAEQEPAINLVGDVSSKGTHQAQRVVESLQKAGLPCRCQKVLFGGGCFH